MNVVANIRIRAERRLQPSGEIEAEIFDYPVGLNPSDTMKKLSAIIERKLALVRRNNWVVDPTQNPTVLVTIDMEEADDQNTQA